MLCLNLMEPNFKATKYSQFLFLSIFFGCHGVGWSVEGWIGPGPGCHQTLPQRNFGPEKSRNIMASPLELGLKRGVGLKFLISCKPDLF